MPKKRTVIILLVIVAVCLLISGIYMFTNRSTKREATRQEIEANVPYAIDWQEATGMEGAEKEIILSLCTFEEEKTIGNNVYRTYDSDMLGDHLYNFQEMMEIAELNGILYIQYYDPQGDMVTLGYSDDGLTEKAVYDTETDTMFYEYGDTVEVWTNFSKGFQWSR